MAGTPSSSDSNAYVAQRQEAPASNSGQGQFESGRTHSGEQRLAGRTLNPASREFDTLHPKPRRRRIGIANRMRICDRKVPAGSTPAVSTKHPSIDQRQESFRLERKMCRFESDSGDPLDIASFMLYDGCTMEAIRWGTTDVKVGTYPSGEPLLRDVHGTCGKRLLLRPSNMTEFMAGLFLADAAEERGTRIPELVIPFVPGARQDRLNDTGDYLFTAKSVAKEVNARGFQRVTILDPHSEVIAGLIDRCRVVHAHECVMPSIEYTAIVSPDAGAEKRAGAVARRMRLPLLHGWKTRDVETGAISGFGLEPSDVTGRVLVVDDICDGGGTFVGLAEVLHKRFLKADLYVTHGIFSQGTQRLLGHYMNIYCTDSVPGAKPGVHILNVCEGL